MGRNRLAISIDDDDIALDGPVFLTPDKCRLDLENLQELGRQANRFFPGLAFDHFSHPSFEKMASIAFPMAWKSASFH